MQMKNIHCFLKKNLSLFAILASLISGLLIGLLKNQFSSQIRDFCSENLFYYFQLVFVKMIGYVAGPLIFLTIVTSILKMKSIKVLLGSGRRYLLSFFAITLLTALISILISMFIFGVDINLTSNANNIWQENCNMLLNFLPSNILDPFIKINLIQIDLMAFLLGILLLFFNENVAWFTNILQKLSGLFIYLMKIIAKFVPLYILVAIINVLWNNDLSSLSSLWKFFLLFLILSILACLLILLITSFYHKAKIRKLFKCAFKPFVVALASANSTVALPKQYSSSKELGIKKEEANFGIPLLMSFFKLSSVIYLAVGAVYFYSLSTNSVSFVWILLATILTTLLTVSIAPVSGGGINNYFIMFEQLSLNAIYLPIIIAFDPIVDFIITGLNTFTQPLQLLNVASKNKHLNKNKLNDKKVILIAGAMDVETNYLIEHLDDKKEELLNDYRAFCGKINGLETIVLKTEIGSKNAMKSTYLAIRKYQPTDLISIGTSGAHNIYMHRGDIIIGERLIGYDLFKKPVLKADKDYIKPYLRINKSQLGTIITSDIWHKTNDEINKIHYETNSDVEEMESYFSCHLAKDYDIDFVALRIVSNNELLKEEYQREIGVELQKKLFDYLKNNS